MSKQAMVRWSGFSLILAGALMALGTVIHPSSETPQIILAQEARLISGHWMLTFYCAFLLVGLPGIYAAHSIELGRSGLVGFILLFFGTVFYAVSGDYGFNAPVLARIAPQALNAINTYPPVAIMDGLMILFMFPGFILFGIALHRSGVIPSGAGILFATGWPLFIIASVLSIMVFESFWYLAIFGSILGGAGIAWTGYTDWVVKKESVLQTADC